MSCQVKVRTTGGSFSPYPVSTWTSAWPRDLEIKSTQYGCSESLKSSTPARRRLAGSAMRRRSWFLRSSISARKRSAVVLSSTTSDSRFSRSRSRPSTRRLLQGGVLEDDGLRALPALRLHLAAFGLDPVLQPLDLGVAAL